MNEWKTMQQKRRGMAKRGGKQREEKRIYRTGDESFVYVAVQWD